MLLQAYQKTLQATENVVQTEYRLIAEITRELETAQIESNPQKKVNALFRNSQLWLTLQVDLVSEDNVMDMETKAGLISLAIWVNKYTSAAMRSNETLKPLICVNKDIMDGLMLSYRNSRTVASTSIQSLPASLSA
jgi:flagellar biosynthesis activator protein FlaF